MYYTDLESFIITIFVLLISIIAVISSYCWLVEHSKRKEAEKRLKEMLNFEISYVNNTSEMTRDYDEYIKEIEKSIKKERSKNNVFM